MTHLFQDEFKYFNILPSEIDIAHLSLTNYIQIRKQITIE